MRILRRLVLLFICASCFSLSYAQEPKLETVIKKGHAGAVKTVSFSPDGLFLATGGRDKTVKIWDIATGRELKTFSGHNARISALTYDKSGKILASGDGYGKIILRNPVSGQILSSFDFFKDFVTDLAFTSDGKYLVAGGFGTVVKIIDVEKAIVVREFESDSYRGISIRISPDNKLILTGEDNRRTKLTDFSSGKNISEFKGSANICGGCLTIADFNSDGTLIASGNNKGSLQIIETKTGNVRQVLIKENDKFTAVDFNPVSSAVLACDENNIFVFNVLDGKQMYNIKAHDKAINAATFSPDGNTFATASDDGTVVMRKTIGGKIIKTFVGFQNTNDYGTNLDKEEYWQYYSRHYFDLKTYIKLSPDGTKLVCGKKDSAASVFDFETGRLLFNLTGHKQAVICFDFSPDGKLLADGSADKSIFIRNAEDGSILKRLKGHKEMIFSVDFSDDGKYLVSSAWDGDMIFWDVETGNEVGMVRDAQAFQAKFLPGGIYAATGGLDKKLLLWETDARKVFREYVGPTDIVPDFDFTANGQKMVSVSWDGKARVWDLSSGFQTLKLSGHTAGINAVLYSKSSENIFTASSDGSVKMWDASTGKEIKQFIADGIGITSIQLTPDGLSLVTCSLEGIIRVWDIASTKEIYALYPLTRKDWFITAPGGFFDASEGAKKLVYFVEGLKSYSPDQFFEKFYRPGLSGQAYKTRGLINQNLNIRDELQKSPPPEVNFHIEKDTVFEQNLALNVDFTDKGGGISEIKILHNGKRLFFEPKITRKIKDGRVQTESFQIELVPGNNEIQISAFSTERIESQAFVKNIYFESKESYPDCYVLIVGINKYENSSLALNYARDDAKGFVDIYLKKSESLFRKIYKTELFDKDATKINFLTKIDEIASKSRPWDVLVFYYAGHGVMLDDKFYFIPVDCVRLFDKDELIKQAVSANELQEKLAKIKALKQILILDACQSGGSVETLGLRGAAKEKAVAQLSRSAGVHVLASAGSEQYATEFKSLGHGLFTYILIEALGGKADGAPQDNKITVYELKSYLDDQVPEFSKKLKGSAQYPYSFSSGNDFPVTFDSRKEH